ncbi:MAG: class I SAM-dependent methyltransferase [Methanosarcinaceae archaeon]|nr:class I SAM-dependent methyltransferase [Methanosarcinaceae archaeon]MDD4332072.1 class I SAM-dependent methyltransferase [Methanosarcinaceae archaeon]MDD4749739.1 class I SAM-dependent methyltransferase [Methanosarcinaceae archaeon]
MEIKKPDWNEIWKNAMERQRKTNRNTECSNIWNSKESAKRFWNSSRENGAERIYKTIEGMPLTPQSRILDIGAGPGTLAIPIAQKVAHVTAVEPAEGMMAVLRENLAECALENVESVYKDWEAVEPEIDLLGPYDLVFASYSLGMTDIKASLKKMLEVCSGYVYLYWFAGETSWDLHSKKLWPALHGCEYNAGPKCDVLYNVLYEMGIYPNVKVFPFEHINRFKSLEDALEHFEPHYGIKTEAQKAILRDYLKEVLLEEKGSFVHKGWSTRVKIWWKNEA